MAHQINTRLLMAMNEDLSEGVACGDAWAMKIVGRIERHNAGDRHLGREFDGKPHHWCSGCRFPEGCVVCTLD